MSEPENRVNGKWKLLVRGAVLLLIVAAAVYLIITYFDRVSNVVLVLIGFGAVIMIHEFGHFIVARLSGIKVEAFSIGFPPILLGIGRSKQGLRFRFLPGFFPKIVDEENRGLLTFSTGEPAPENGTEYRISLLPFGGFVKMLGQEDTGAAEKSDDPRSFANKSIFARVCVVAAGVVFNAISAAIAFIIVFIVGISLTPAVVGGVYPGSPAAESGLEPGDRIVEINGERDLDFNNILIAAAFSGKDESVKLTVKHTDGELEQLTIVPRKGPTGGGLKIFGIELPQSLTIARIEKPNKLEQRTGLLPGDKVISVNGKPVSAHWQFEQVVGNALTPTAKLAATRGEDKTKVTTELPLKAGPVTPDFQTNYETSHIYSMVPRMRIAGVTAKPATLVERLLDKVGVRKLDIEKRKPPLKKGDIIIAVGDVKEPTYDQLRKLTTEHENKELPITVLRPTDGGKLEQMTVNVVPYRNPISRKVEIGIVPLLDLRHSVVAQTISTAGADAQLDIPPGARITKVDGRGVDSFYDVISIIRASEGERISIDYRLSDQVAGSCAFVPPLDGGISAKSGLAEPVPFEPLEELYKASGPAQAIVLGGKKTYLFIAQSYLTVKGLIAGSIGPGALMGPLGILTISYEIASNYPAVKYLYFLAMVSAIIAVLNLLPIPVLDGGAIVLLLIEKARGEPLSPRVQDIIARIGMAIILLLFLYLTMRDINRFFL